MRTRSQVLLTGVPSVVRGSGRRENAAIMRRVCGEVVARLRRGCGEIAARMRRGCGERLWREVTLSLRPRYRLQHGVLEAATRLTQSVLGQDHWLA